MITLSPVVKIKNNKENLPPIIKVNNKIFKVKA
jgi:hypothetical protein